MLPTHTPTTCATSSAPRSLLPSALCLRSLLYSALALVAVAATFYLIVNQEITRQSQNHLNSTLADKALKIGQHAQARPNSTTLPNTDIPVFYHWGPIQSAQTSRYWPKDCNSSIERKHQGFHTQKCGAEHLTILETPLINQKGESQVLTVWTTATISGTFSQLSSGNIISMIALVLSIAYLTSRWVSRTITTPIKALTANAQQMAYGEYNIRLPSSSIKEINTLAFSLNVMAKNLQERDEHIHRTAYKDQLTGLDNRSAVLQVLRERIQASNEALTIVTWGIDNLDGITEVLGHEVAERVLIKMAQRTRRLCKEHLSIARLEGHIYCIMVPRTIFTRFLQQQRFKRTMRSTLRVGQHKLDIHCHAGIAHYPEHSDHPETLMRRAEIARQLAAKTSRTSIEFEPRMEQRSASRLELINELKQAIQDEQFCLYFQPKMNLRTDNINQAEVLLRWLHPSRGLLAPGAFIELAEQTGLIREITRWVLSKVYALIELCAKQNIRLSVNLSALDLEDSSLEKHIQELHKHQPEAAKNIVLEITESTAMRDPDAALETLKRLSQIGFQIAIDDFGSGYSSLSYLKRFPVTELKIDRCLVQGADQDIDGQIILESTIQMGHIMGLLVTVEGVETDGEFELVKSLGADYVQGFWLSRPIPYEEFRLKHLVGNGRVYDQETQPV